MKSMGVREIRIARVSCSSISSFKACRIYLSTIWGSM